MRSESDGQAPPGGLAFLTSHQLLTAPDVARALKRMAHEIVERNGGLDDVLLVGLQRGGAPFAQALAATLREIAGHDVPCELLDVSFYRDDLEQRPLPSSAPTTLSHDLGGTVVVLVDDVLFTGRTIRAALNALADWGRPKSVQLAVMVDRGHRELPIRPDFVGKNLPSSRDETVVATVDGVWIGVVTS
jgi:pyrimidine operon attenuation protein / uracil phosphoribosyltransferase